MYIYIIYIGIQTEHNVILSFHIDYFKEGCTQVSILLSQQSLFKNDLRSIIPIRIIFPHANKMKSFHYFRYSQ